MYGDKRTAFDKFVKAASPTTAQTTAARNDVFKKAGLASTLQTVLVAHLRRSHDYFSIPKEFAMATSPVSIHWSDATTICLTFGKGLDPASVPSADAFYINGDTANVISNVSVRGKKLYLSLESNAASTLHSQPGDIDVTYYASGSGKKLCDTSGKKIGSFSKDLPRNSQLLTSDIFLSRTALSGDTYAVNNLLSEVCSRNICLKTTSVASLTLTVDNGVFTTSSAYAELTSNGKTITVSGTQSQISTALNSISLSIDAEARTSNTLVSTIRVRLEDDAGISSNALHIFSEDVESSSFTMKGQEYAYVNSVSDLNSSYFTSANIYSDDLVIDAEKSPNRFNDDQLCWAATASNMLTWTGYGKAVNAANGHQQEDAVFEALWSHFSDEGSTASYGISWFMTGLYDAPYNWAQPDSDSGNYMGCIPQAFQALDIYPKDSAAPYVDDLANAILAGDAAGLAIYDSYGDSGHAITCWGLSIDLSRNRNDPKWLTGIYITDSDDAENTTSPQDEMLYVHVSWDARRKAYQLKGYDSEYYWEGSFTTLARKESLKETLTNTEKSSFDLTITNGNTQHVSSGGIAFSTLVLSGGSQIISRGGLTFSSTVSSGGIQVVAGYAEATTVSKGGKVQVNKGGVVSTAQILDGGAMILSKGGIAKAVSISSTGTLTVKAGAIISSVTLKTGAKMSTASGNVLYGKNSFTGATVTGGTKDKRVSLAKKATLSVGTKTNMKKLHLKTDNASITVTGTGNTLGSLKTNKSTAISYDVSKVKASGTSYMLSLSTKNTQKLGKFSVNVKKGQGVGVYELSKNIAQAKNTVYTINLAGKKQGTAKLNGLGLIKGTAIYAVNSASNNISLTVAKTGKTLKGTTKADKLTGTANWDVFYGGKGNDTITGKNGRDVAVYDKTSWGKDTIDKTSGTMTLLFKDLEKGDVIQKKSGTDMVITKKGYSNQKITIKGWSNDTHNIVFGSGMTAFNTYLKTTNSTDKQIVAARNEAFKKAGLASA